MDIFSMLLSLVLQQASAAESYEAGARDMCVSMEGEWLADGTCKVQPLIVEVPVPLDILECPDGFVAWDQAKGGGEWAYCEPGTRPDGSY